MRNPGYLVFVLSLSLLIAACAAPGVAPTASSTTPTHEDGELTTMPAETLTTGEVTSDWR